MSKPFCRQITESPDKKILVVSHGCTLGFLQAMLMKFRFEDVAGARFSVRSGSISRVAIGTDGRVTANHINHRIY